MKTNGYVFKRKIDGIETDIFVYDKKIELYKRINITGIPDIVITTNEDHHTEMLNTNDTIGQYDKIMKIIADKK